MRDPFFFGYGSLVNRQTHTYPQARRAKVAGWQRAWRRASDRGWCYLTAVPAPNAVLWGLMAAVPKADWAALDKRESAYQRLATRLHQDDETAGNPPTSPASIDLAIYAIAPERQRLPDDAAPVLLSYLDVVVQGYLREFGEEGVAHFFDTTLGWEAPILDDRAAPIYPRHQDLSSDERALVDDQLARRSVRLIQRD